jgi:4'-phosphopantetheinyl transferase
LKRSIGVTINLHLTREAQSFDIVLGVVAEHEYSRIIAQAGDFLAPQEAAYFERLRFIRRQQSYLLGRYAAKIAVQKALDEPELRELEIIHGVFGQPLVACSSRRTSGISISHCTGFAVALTFPIGHPMGIDIEKIDPDREATIRTQLSQRELEWVESGIGARGALMTLLWTAKEALSKALTTGLMSPIEIYHLNQITPVGKGVWTGAFEKFGQYQFVGWVVDRYALSIVLPKYTNFLGDLPDFAGTFSAR